MNFDVVLAVTKSTVSGNHCTSNAGLFFDLRFSTISGIPQKRDPKPYEDVGPYEDPEP